MRGQLVHTDTSDHPPQGESKPIDQINGPQCPSSPIRVVVTCCMPVLLGRKCAHSVPLEGQSSTLNPLLGSLHPCPHPGVAAQYVDSESRSGSFRGFPPDPPSSTCSTTAGPSAGTAPF